MTAAVPPRFGRVQVEMLECVYQHRLLSTGQLHSLYRPGLSLRRTQRALAAMERVGWLASVRRPGGMKLWFVTERGADAVEAVGNRAESRRKVIPVEQAAGPLQQHTLAVNEVGVIFARAARERGEEFGPLSWRNEIAHPIGQVPGGRRSEVVIADAVLSYVQMHAERSASLRLAFLELDRATMAVESLAAKLNRYERLRTHTGPVTKQGTLPAPLWQERYSHFPALLVVLANGTRRQLQRRRWLVVALWKRDHPKDTRTIALHVCLLEDLIEQGPFAPIFESHWPEGDGKGFVDWTGQKPETPEPEQSGPPLAGERPPEHEQPPAGAAPHEPDPPEDPEPSPEPEEVADDPGVPPEPEPSEDPEPYAAPVRDAASAPDLLPLGPWDEGRGWGRS